MIGQNEKVETLLNIKNCAQGVEKDHKELPEINILMLSESSSFRYTNHQNISQIY